MAALAAAPVTLVAAGGGTPSLSESRPATADALARALRDAGARVKFEQQIRQPFFTVPATIFEVDGEGVQVFAFRDARAASEAAATVSRDGRKIGTTAPFWIGPPHFFRRSNLLVLYLGDDGQLLQRLQDALGPQFAGA